MMKKGKRNNCGKSIHTQTFKATEQQWKKKKKDFRLVSQPNHHRLNLICSMQTCQHEFMHAKIIHHNSDHTTIHIHTSPICHVLHQHDSAITHEKKTNWSGVCLKKKMKKKNCSLLPFTVVKKMVSGRSSCVRVHVSRPKSNSFGSTFDIKRLIVRVICAQINSMSNKSWCKQSDWFCTFAADHCHDQSVSFDMMRRRTHMHTDTHFHIRKKKNGI